jgi:YD repeat-containing protein
MIRRFTYATLLVMLCFSCTLAQSQTVTVSPTSLGFGNQVVATTSAAKAVTLKNGQTVVLAITSIAVSGDYAQTNSCGTSLNAGASCTISVTFTPTTTGTRTGTLTITDNASNSPQTVPLTGSGVLAAALTPATLSFGSQVVGTTSVAKVATLKNNQTVTLTISSIATSGDYAQTNNCGTSLGAGLSCTINVTFTPTATGSRTGTLTVTDSATNSPQTTALTGTGLAPVVVSPATLAFGNEVVNTTSAAKVVTLTNNQSVVLNITSIATTGDYAQTNTCGTSVVAGGNCTISVIFKPTATGSRPGTLTVTDSAGNSPQTVSLAGTGVAAPHISSLSITSGTVGTPVTINGTNFGATQVAGSSVTFNTTLTTPTSWTGTKIVVPVPPGASTGNVFVTANGGNSNGILFTVQSAANGPVNYFYDDLNRLVGVTDATGNSAQYSYDAAGNIVSISRITPTQVSILGFSPEIGPVGTAVTIDGTGFSTTPSQNTVKFNGVTASVSSSTSTQLQVTVPATATTGVIAVTTPNGSATSSANFTVTPDSGVPTIISFSPISGVAGSTVTVTGTDFDPTLANDKLRLNGTPAVVSSAVPTTLVTTVPAATASGHFSLYAPAGSSTSSQDFYVPFYSHLASDIGFTARTTIGGNQAVSLSGGSVGLVLFDSSTVQSVSVGISGSTFPAGCSVYLIAPNNSVLNSASCSTATSDLPSTTLTQSGTYTVGIDPGAGNSGSLTLSVLADITGTITIDGAPVVVTTAPGQDARLSFTVPPTVAPGKELVVYATNVTTPSAYLSLMQGTTLENATSINNNPAGQTFYFANTLSAGTYQLLLQPSGTTGGSQTLQIVSAPTDFTGTLTIPSPGTTGPATQVPTAGNLGIGQNASLTFAGTAGQKLSFNVSNSTIGTALTSCLVTIYDPTGAAISTGNCGLGTSTYIDTITLTSTGTYIFFISPLGPPAGSVAISVNNDQDVTTPAISIGGSAVTATTTVAGQDVRLSFTATASQHIGVYATNVLNTSATMSLVSPTGAIMSSIPIRSSPSGSTFFTDAQLTAAGTYQVWIQHNSTYIGSETLQITTVPADFTGTLTVPSPGTTGPITEAPASGALAAGQNASLTFAGTSGQQLSFNVVNSTIGTGSTSCFVTIFDPSHNPVGAKAYCGTGATFVNTLTLAVTGTYTFYIDPQSAAIGSVGISVNNAQDVTTPAITIGGSAVTATTTVPGQDVRLSFTATAAQNIGVSVTNVTNSSALLYVLSPTGSTLASNYISANQSYFINADLTAAGTYQLWVQHSSAYYGSETLQLLGVPADFTGTLTVQSPGTTGPITQVPTTGTLALGQNASLSFAGTAGQKLSFNVSNSTISSCAVTVYDPNHLAVRSGSCATGTTYVDTVTLALTGTYTFYIDPQGAATGSVGISVNNDQDVTTPTITIGGSAVTTTTTVPGQDVRLSFTATASQHIGVYATNVTNPSATMYLVSPTGATLTYTSVNNNPTGQTFFIDYQPTVAGTYQLWVAHSSANFGSETLQIITVPADFTGTLTVPSPGTTGPATQVPTTGSLAIGQNASLTFSGTTGQQLSFNVTNSTIGPYYYSCRVTVYDPTQRSVASGYCGTGTNYIDTVTQASTGTYTVYLDPQGTSTGSASVSINNAQDVTTPPISIGGSAVTATTTVAGQDVRLTFTASAAQHIAVYATNVTTTSATMYILSPTGTRLASTSISSGQSGFVDTQLTAAGNYQLWIQHSSTYIGSETLQITGVPADFTGTLTVPSSGTTGPATQVPTTGTLASGQNASLTFTGTAGQKLSFNLLNSTIGTSAYGCYVTIYDPTQKSVGSGYCGPGYAYIDTITLASTGIYTFYIDPQGSVTGSVAVSVNNDQDVTTPAISIGGSAVTTTTTVAGQDVRLTFTASAAQHIAVYATGVTNPSATMYVLSPAGTTLTSASINNGSGQTFFVDTQLAAPGNYQLWIQHYSTYIGSETLQITTVASDFTAALAIPAAGTTGPATQVPTTGTLAAGQNASLTIAGTAGQKLSFNVTNSTIGTTSSSCLVTVYDPSQRSVATGYCGKGAGYFDTVTLALTGTYTFYINPQGTATGSLAVSVNNDQDVTTPAISIGGGPVTTTTTVAGQDVRLSFTESAAQHIAVTATSVSNPAATMYVLSPTGTTLVSTSINNSAGQTFFVDTNLTAAGTYQLWIQHNATNIGSETLQITVVPADFTGTLTVPALGTTGPATQVPTTGALVAGQNASLTFSGTTGQKLSFNVSGSNIGTTASSCVVTIYDPTQRSVGSGNCGTGATFVNTVTLASSGTFTFYIDPQGAATGSVSISVNNDSDFTGTLTVPGPGTVGPATQVPTTGNLMPGQNASLTFSGTTGQKLSFNVSSTIGTTSSACVVTIYDPTMKSIGSGNCGTGATSVNPVTLASTGTFTFYMVPQGGAVGNASISVNNDSDWVGTLTVPAAGTAGPATQVPTTGNLLMGQNASLTFSGTAGQILSFNFVNSTIGTAYYNCTATLYDPSNNKVGSGWCGGQTGNDLFAPVTLASTGTYNLYITPGSGVTGNVSVSINNDQTVTGTASIGGSPVTLTTTVAGQSSSLSFTGSANQIITVLMSNGTYPGCSVSNAGVNINIYNPDGTKLTGYFCVGSGYLSRITLPQNGTYTLTLTPGAWTYTGSMTFTLYNVVDVNTSITAGGAPVTVTTTVVGQYANLTFSGSPGQRIALNLTNDTYPGCTVSQSGITVTIFNPDASKLASAGCIGNYFFDTMTLAQTGTYTITVNPTPYTGSITLTLYSVPADVSGSITIGQAGLSFTTVIGQNANITFSNPAAQTVTLHWASGTYTTCSMTVTNSSNVQVGSGGCQGATGTLSMTNLAAGSYNVLVNPSGTNTGGLTLSATSP